ncbi:MAG: FtsX-like permease family protein [Flavobacteriaceae bacterium]|nr:FtsX-like permease family protein [Flavobacteriaceae bacterium]
MHFSWFIARRFAFSKRKQNLINIISRLSFVVTVLGAASLFIVLSGFGGLKNFSLEFTGLFDPDISVFPKLGKHLTVNDGILKQLDSIDGITYSQIVEDKIYLSYRDAESILTLKGVDSNYHKVVEIEKALALGNWIDPEADHQVVVGAETYTKLNIVLYSLDEQLKIMAPKPGSGQITNLAQAFNSDYLSAVGVYNINDQTNAGMVFGNIDAARYVLSVEPHEVSSIAMSYNSSIINEPELRLKLSNIFKDSVEIKNRIQLNDALYKMLMTENLAVYFIFTLILIIALFNTVGALIITIIEKRKNLKLLYHIGAKMNDLKKIFFLQGIFITVLGGIIGLVIGSILVLLQLQFSLFYITPNLPYPVELSFWNYLIVLATIGVLALITSYIPVQKINLKFLEA